MATERASRTRERSVPPPPPVGGAGTRPSALATFGLTSLGGIVVVALAGAVMRLGGGPWVTSVLGAAIGGSLGLEALRRLRRPGPPRPWWLHWDPVGYSAAAGLAGLAAVSAVETMFPGPGLFQSSQVLLSGALAGTAFAAAVGWALARAEGSSPGEAARALVRVWADPPADWAFFVLGALMTLPLAALISPVAWDSDSGRLLLDASRVRHEGLGFVVETQQVFLPMLIFPPVVAAAGVYGAMALSVVTMQAMTGTVAYIARKLTGGVLAPVAAILAVLAIRPLIRQADVLPMYPLMLALGYLAGWTGLRAIRGEGRSRIWLAVATGFLLAATAEAHDIGKLFVAVPLFLLALEPTRRGLRGMVLIYATLALFSLPRIVVNLAEGGLAAFTTNRVDWMVGSGYTRLINAEFWEHAVRSKTAFFADLVRPYWGGDGGWLVAIPAVAALVGFAAARWRARAFALLCGGLMLAGLLQTNAPPHPRYLSPILPGVAIAAGVGASFIATRWRRGLAIGAVVVALGVAAGFSYHWVVTTAHLRQEAILGHRLERITDPIDDGRAVTGVRPVRLMSADPDLRLLPNKAFTEEEWVTYLTWPSDREVLEVLRAYDVGWVVLLADRRLEVDYHQTWVGPVHGKRVRHADMILRSPSFCYVARSGGHILYRVGPCQD